MIFQQRTKVLFIPGEIFQGINMVQSEVQRLKGMIKTDQLDRAGYLTSGSEDGERICSRAQSHVPNNKFAVVALQPLRQIELTQIERLRLSHWTDHRMKRFPVYQRMDAPSAVGQLHDAISHWWCGEAWLSRLRR